MSLTPLPAKKWDLSKAAHLLNRAGFGGSPAEVRKLAELGLDGAVNQLVDYESIPDDTPNPEWAKPDETKAERLLKARNATPEERRELQRMEQRTQTQRIIEMRSWWLKRMAHGPRPLQEKLTVFWHGHFATSAQKVREAYLMWRQNDIFRRHGSGNWLTLLTEVSKDPAMLIWLDQGMSRREKPNENFARELMELFTLGEGNYAEKDVTEAARALTGWSLGRTRDAFEYRPRVHDAGEKTIFGKTGRYEGDDVLKLVVNHPQAARFITAKLWRYFVSEQAPEELVTALAAEFRRTELQFKPVLKAMFRSEAFYAESVMHNQVKSPVQLLVGTVRMLEREMPSGIVGQNALRLLGQDLLNPPNVKGWDGGLSWITTNNLLNRYNLASMLVLGQNALPLGGRGRGQGGQMMQRMVDRGVRDGYGPVDVEKLFTPEERGSKTKLVQAMEQRFLLAPLKEKHRKAINDYLDSQAELDTNDIRQALHLLMSTPEYQLT